ncbi:MAG: hypothetical protein ACI841_004567 [Planctomycetota bacterium]|jgi:hypothetical protein
MGKMKVVQMLAHCQFPLLSSFGEFESKRTLIGRLFGGMAKRKLVDSDAPFNKNSPTDPRFLNKDATGFDEHRSKMVELVERFHGTGSTSEKVHPFFGKMSTLDWDRLMWKHLDHHLRQFGA